MLLSFYLYDANEYGYLNPNTMLVSGHTASWSSGQIKYAKNKTHVFLEITVWDFVINNASSDNFLIYLPYEMSSRRASTSGIGYLYITGVGQIRGTSIFAAVHNDTLSYVFFGLLTNTSSTYKEEYITDSIIQASIIYPTTGVRDDNVISSRYPL